MPSRARQLSLLGAESAEHTRRLWRGAVRSSKTSKALRPSPKPWECVVLAVDTARRSGWSVWLKGHRLDSGELDTIDALAVQCVVASALSSTEATGLPCVLVLEKPWGGSVAVVAALGAARERWLAAWRGHPLAVKSKVVLVSPSTWRSAVLGAGWAAASRETVRRMEQSMAAGMKGERAGSGAVPGDEAAACCIGYWGCYAGEVGKVLGKRARERSMKSWHVNQSGKVSV